MEDGVGKVERGIVNRDIGSSPNSEITSRKVEVGLLGEKLGHSLTARRMVLRATSIFNSMNLDPMEFWGIDQYRANLAIAQASVGESELAVQTAEKIDSRYISGDSNTQIAATITLNGDVDIAKKFLNETGQQDQWARVEQRVSELRQKEQSKTPTNQEFNGDYAELVAKNIKPEYFGKPSQELIDSLETRGEGQLLSHVHEAYKQPDLALLELGKDQAREGKISTALNLAENLRLEDKSEVLREVVIAKLKIGDFEGASTLAEEIPEEGNKCKAFADIALIQAKSNQDSKAMFQAAIDNALYHVPEEDRVDAYKYIFESQVKAGFSQINEKVLNLWERSNDLGDSGDNSDEAELVRLTTKAFYESQLIKGKDVSGYFDEARDKLYYVDAVVDGSQGQYVEDAANFIAVTQVLTGNGTDVGKTAEKFAEAIEDYAFDTPVEDRVEGLYMNVARAYIELGDLDRAGSIAQLVASPLNKVDLYLALAKAHQEKGLTPPEIKSIEPDLVQELVTTSQPNEIYSAVGAFKLLDLQHLPADLSERAKISFRMGVAEGASDDKTRNNIISEIQRDVFNSSQGEDIPKNATTKAFIENIVASQDYEVVSNFLLGKLAQLSKNGESLPDDIQTLRILKGLIEIENPKGRTLATQAFAKGNLHPRHQEYLAKKLFSSGYWDKSLGIYLQQQVDEAKENAYLKTKQSDVLKTIVSEFGLNPDLTVYKLLEKRGDLKGMTLEERVTELKQVKESFGNKTRDGIISLLISRDSSLLLKFFYATNVGEYSYSVVNNYNYQKFAMMMETISKLEVHEPTLDRFKSALVKGGYSDTEAQTVIERLRDGRPPIEGEQRNFQFSTRVEYGSTEEKALARLQDIWKTELKGLLVAQIKGLAPNNIRENNDLLEEAMQENGGRYEMGGREIAQLRLDNERISLADISAIARDFRSRLRSINNQNRINKSPLIAIPTQDSEVIVRYLQYRKMIPSSEATEEFRSHLEETISDLEGARSSARQVDSSSEGLELTFLDKNRDFVRSLRFADAAVCCFNSNVGSGDRWIARLNKDPLSFVMDLSKQGSKSIGGFVFGRMGINPETGKPVIMLNGIYSQYRGEAVVNNILRIIDEKMGGYLKADTIAIASQYGGTIDQPTGYRRGEMEIDAIRAIQRKRNQGEAYDYDDYEDYNDDEITEDGASMPEVKVYDDIGTVANGRFTFEGYIKQAA